MKAEDFATAMDAMASLRAPIDAFFTAVQVNAENEILRRNRLNLLHRIRAICLSRRRPHQTRRLTRRPLSSWPKYPGGGCIGQSQCSGGAGPPSRRYPRKPYVSHT